MSVATSPSRPVWLKESDELPHKLVDEERWAENYLSLVNSPESGVALWMHLSHVQGHDGLPTLWDEVMYITLPGDRYLVTRGFGPGRVEDANGDGRGEIAIAGLSFRCDEPFRSWTKRFDGAARLVSGDDLRAGPVGDGLYVPVALEI